MEFIERTISVIQSKSFSQTDQAVIAICELEWLLDLSIHSNKGPDRGIQAISRKLKILQTLSISGNPDVEDISTLRELKGLQALFASDTKVNLTQESVNE